VALPEDPEVRVRCFRNAIRNWNVEGYITVTRRIEEWLKLELKEYSLREIKRILWEFSEAGGQIEERKETRPEYWSYEYWYRLRVGVGNRHIFFECILDVEEADNLDGSTIQIVSVHDD
jgi:hypothetical protein